MPRRTAGWVRGTLIVHLCISILLVGLGVWFWTLQSEQIWLLNPGITRWSWSVGILLAYLTMAGVAIGLPWYRRQKVQGQLRQQSKNSANSLVTITYASQTGFAHSLAVETEQLLKAAGIACLVVPLEQLAGEDLEGLSTLLVIASTTGDGDAPEHARSFQQKQMSQRRNDVAFSYALMSLGDRHYQHYCQFGREIDQWLQAQNAQQLFDTIEVDNADPTAIDRWFSQLQRHFDKTGATSVSPILPSADVSKNRSTKPRVGAFHDWRIESRLHWNPGSQGGPAYQIRLLPDASETFSWQAGDIIEVVPQNSPDRIKEVLDFYNWDAQQTVEFQGESTILSTALSKLRLPDQFQHAEHLTPVRFLKLLSPHQPRAYSIASVPEDGVLELLVRLVKLPSGRYGVASHWLCEGSNVGAPVTLRIRSNPAFHAPDPDRPLIMIGNGTGLAGLMGHLRSRCQAEGSRNWLMFGERNERIDYFYQEELGNLQCVGLLERLSIAFSRDQEHTRYVQDLLVEQADDVREWIQQGAAIYVCGSREGMAPAVDAALRKIAGDATIQEMLDSGIYRRDIY